MGSKTAWNLFLGLERRLPEGGEGINIGLIDLLMILIEIMLVCLDDPLELLRNGQFTVVLSLLKLQGILPCFEHLLTAGLDRNLELVEILPHRLAVLVTFQIQDQLLVRSKICYKSGNTYSKLSITF